MSHFFHSTEARTSILSPSSAGSLPAVWENGGRGPWIPMHTAVPLSVTQEALQNPLLEWLWKTVIQFIYENKIYIVKSSLHI